MNRNLIFALPLLLTLGMSSCVFSDYQVEIDTVANSEEIDRQGLAISSDHDYILVATVNYNTPVQEILLYDRNENLLGSASESHVIAVCEDDAVNSSDFYVLTSTHIKQYAASNAGLAQTQNIALPNFNSAFPTYIRAVDFSQHQQKIFLLTSHYYVPNDTYETGMYVYNQQTNSWSTETMLVDSSGQSLDQIARVMDTTRGSNKLVVVTGYSVGPGLPDTHNNFDIHVFNQNTLSWTSGFQLEIEKDIIDIQMHHGNLGYLAFTGHNYATPGGYVRLTKMDGTLQDEINVNVPAAVHSEHYELNGPNNVTGNRICFAGKDDANKDVVCWKLTLPQYTVGPIKK